MSETLQLAQQSLDRAQSQFFKTATTKPSKEHISAWFNACLNSACGPVAEFGGNAAVVGALEMWLATAKAKAAKPAAASGAD
ncbi:MAG TPA: hypothetical protein PK225_09720 [Azonexus sp.]|nr:hypothetical protein [Azonexus sp.]